MVERLIQVEKAQADLGFWIKNGSSFFVKFFQFGHKLRILWRAVDGVQGHLLRRRSHRGTIVTDQEASELTTLAISISMSVSSSNSFRSSGHDNTGDCNVARNQAALGGRGEVKDWTE